MCASSNQPTDAQDRLDRAYALYEEDEFEDALRQCDMAIEIDPSLAEAHNLRGIVLEELDRKATARRAYQEAIRLDPGFHEARENLASLETESGAAERLDRAYALYEEDEFEGALRECDAAIEVDPALAKAHNLKGIVLDELGRKAEALHAYREAIRLDPGFRAAEENLVDLEAEIESANRPVTIATFDHAVMAYLARSKLESEGIQAFVADEYIATVNWLYASAIGGVKLQVRRSDARRAREILDRAPVDADAFPEDEADADDDGPRCPACGSSNVYTRRFAARPLFASWLLLGFPLPFLKRKWRCGDCGHEWKAG